MKIKWMQHRKKTAFLLAAIMVLSSCSIAGAKEKIVFDPGTDKTITSIIKIVNNTSDPFDPQLEISGVAANAGGDIQAELYVHDPEIDRYDLIQSGNCELEPGEKNFMITLPYGEGVVLNGDYLTVFSDQTQGDTYGIDRKNIYEKGESNSFRFFFTYKDGILLTKAQGLMGEEKGAGADISGWKDPDEGGDGSAADGLKDEADMNRDAPNHIYFTDTAGHWGEDAVSEMASRGIVKGYEDGSFHPDESIKRAEFCQMIANAFDYQRSASVPHPFSDVGEGDWYYDAVNALYGRGIVAGTSADRFDPDENITREQMAVILHHTALDRELSMDSLREYVTFSDDQAVSGYARKAIEAMYKAEFISGVKNAETEGYRFEPQQNATRAEAVSVVLKLLGDQSGRQQGQ